MYDAAAGPVLIVFDGLNHGGAERHIVDLAAQLDPMTGRRAIVATAPGPLLRELESAGITHEPMRPVRNVPWRLLAAARRIDMLARRHGASVLHSHSRVCNLECMLATKLLQTPAVHVATAHNVYPDKHSMSFWPAHTICVSAAAQAYVRQHSRARTRVILDGVKRPKGQRARSVVRASLPLPDAATVFINVGRLSEQKAQYLLLQAFAKVRADAQGDAHLLLVGEGEQRPRIESDIARMGLGQCVHLLGARDDVTDLLAASDVFVLSSRWEGLGMALVEAAASGLPLISFEVGGVVEVVKEGVTGVLVAPGDIDALAAAMRRLRDDPELRAALGSAGKLHFEQHFSLEKCVLATEQFYRESIAANARALLR